MKLAIALLLALVACASAYSLSHAAKKSDGGWSNCQKNCPDNCATNGEGQFWCADKRAEDENEENKEDNDEDEETLDKKLSAALKALEETMKTRTEHDPITWHNVQLYCPSNYYKNSDGTYECIDSSQKRAEDENVEDKDDDDDDQKKAVDEQLYPALKALVEMLKTRTEHDPITWHHVQLYCKTNYIKNSDGTYECSDNSPDKKSDGGWSNCKKNCPDNCATDGEGQYWCAD